jgi:hypothetical protein
MKRSMSDIARLEDGAVAAYTLRDNISDREVRG